MVCGVWPEWCGSFIRGGAELQILRGPPKLHKVRCKKSSWSGFLDCREPGPPKYPNKLGPYTGCTLYLGHHFGTLGVQVDTSYLGTWILRVPIPKMPGIGAQHLPNEALALGSKYPTTRYLPRP